MSYSLAEKFNLVWCGPLSCSHKGAAKLNYGCIRGVGKRQWKPTQHIHAHSLPADQWGRRYIDWCTQFNYRRWNIANKVGNLDNGCLHCSQAKTEIRLHRIHALSYAVNCLKKWLAYLLSQCKSQHAENAPKQRSRRTSNTARKGALVYRLG